MKVGRAQPSPVQFRKRLPAEEKGTSGFKISMLFMVFK